MIRLEEGSRFHYAACKCRLIRMQPHFQENAKKKGKKAKNLPLSSHKWNRVIPQACEYGITWICCSDVLRAGKDASTKVCTCQVAPWCFPGSVGCGWIGAELSWPYPGKTISIVILFPWDWWQLILPKSDLILRCVGLMLSYRGTGINETWWGLVWFWDSRAPNEGVFNGVIAIWKAGLWLFPMTEVPAGLPPCQGTREAAPKCFADLVPRCFMA